MQHHSGITSFEVRDLLSMTPISSANGPNSHETTMQLQRKTQERRCKLPAQNNAITMQK
jgi:hypothetical protein